MAQYLVTGGNPLSGHVSISGNKNSVLKLMAATILTKGTCTIRNVPNINDVSVMAEILTSLGATVTGLGTSALSINTTNVQSSTVSPEMATKLRASLVLLAPLLVRFGQVKLGLPGGDTIGKRAFNTHLDALSSFGINFEITADFILGKCPPLPSDKISVFLDETSVTATENVLMFAACQGVTTTIQNAACEPHVIDLENFLIQMGAQISGVGSNTVIVTGTVSPKPVEFSVGPDYIDAGTFAIAAAATNGSITLSPVLPDEMQMILLFLSRFGVKYSWPKPDTLQIHPSSLSVDPEKLGIRQKFQTRPWPGFPTDLMSPLIVLATQAQGSVLMHDWMYETRMFFTDKLVSMGANITLCDPHRVIISGPTKLQARHTSSPDIRAGMSILIASLCATGQSTIDHVEIIERGYENPVERLCALGAKISRTQIA
ncbi:MAG: UDP-N-acetylglucosamine 1-carboxyvinyltransferase [Candidatus Amesbacteria bacterium GW2011_GWA2_42_12]|uniref:UDP-N-acetylglucosamine 1-carboxyvinyltransferase n=1 Tax=Candidatus Amesbacteria bacterium GW2011_GWA2_42_12 TaxID=1618356 RepID=A0A0G0Y6P9_9BACT|nr:MAG: UDP-N-acetylglucosamine 1-carboxyvinyltransferase [Candidatus Amesbacteria bacterium GW2011_GWA2_42_12]